MANHVASSRIGVNTEKTREVEKMLGHNNPPADDLLTMEIDVRWIGGLLAIRDDDRLSIGATAVGCFIHLHAGFLRSTMECRVSMRRIQKRLRISGPILHRFLQELVSCGHLAHSDIKPRTKTTFQMLIDARDAARRLEAKTDKTAHTVSSVSRAATQTAHPASAVSESKSKTAHQELKTAHQDVQTAHACVSIRKKIEESIDRGDQTASPKVKMQPYQIILDACGGDKDLASFLVNYTMETLDKSRAFAIKDLAAWIPLYGGGTVAECIAEANKRGWGAGFVVNEMKRMKQAGIRIDKIVFRVSQPEAPKANGCALFSAY